MPVNLVTITGNLETLIGGTPTRARIWFMLNRPDWNGTGQIFAPEYVEVIADTSTGAFSAALQSTDDLEAGAYYSAILKYREALDGKDREYEVATFLVPTGGPYLLTDLLNLPVNVPIPYGRYIYTFAEVQAWTTAFQPAYDYIIVNEDGYYTFYERDTTGTATDLVTVYGDRFIKRGRTDITYAHYPKTDVGLASAITAAQNTTLYLQSDLSENLPADYSGTLLEYEHFADGRWVHTSTPFGGVKRLLRSQHGDHPGEAMATVHVETQALGNANGPTNADYGVSVGIHKKGYGTGTAESGEINGMTVFVRQDGDQGLPNGDPGSSDCTGILANVQNRGDCGFSAILEATSSNIDIANAITDSMQIQFGVQTRNASPSPLKYGYVVVATSGTITHAFYAGEGGGVFNNLFKAPNHLTIDGDGNYSIQSVDWPIFAAQIYRDAGVDGALKINQRGVGGIAITALDAGEIQFATDNLTRWRINSAGSMRPNVDAGVNFGTASFRISTGYFFTVSSTVGNITTVNSTTGYITTINSTTANVGSLAASTSVGFADGLGAGDLVTQLTDKTTGVTINKITGRITLAASSIPANSSVSFLVTNSLITTKHNVIVQPIAIGSANYSATATDISTGSFRVIVRNETGGALAQAFALQFTALKGATT